MCVTDKVKHVQVDLIIMWIGYTKLDKKIKVERLREEQIGDIVALSSYIGWDYNKEEIETIFDSGII